MGSQCQWPRYPTCCSFWDQNIIFEVFFFFGSYVFVNITLVVRYRMPGYWRRPIGRMYGYNMDLGENYYNHVLDHVDSAVDRRDRDGHTPGPLTYSERMARRFQGSDRVSEL